MTSLLAVQKPHWKPDTAHGYHSHTIEFTAGELIYRVDLHHYTYGQFARDELDGEFYVDKSNDIVEARVSPVTRKEVDTSNVRSMELQTEKSFLCSGAFRLGRSLVIFNETRLHRAQMSTVNGITNARSLARIYYLLIGDINENGKKRKRLLSEKTIIEATKNVILTGERDQNCYNIPTTFRNGGFQIYGDCCNIFDDDVFGHFRKKYLRI
ncbi:unnamed protein product [Rotaria sp. Silwood2]|nr:unnamed protein product [Rotaria sp. Silwood2]CAF4257839.1 unnamed protein product [Rotaria sp. Silwood2]